MYQCEAGAIRRVTVFFSCRTVNIWNSLPSEVVNAPSLNSFKNRLDIFLMNQDSLYSLYAELTRTGVEVLYRNNLND